MFDFLPEHWSVLTLYMTCAVVGGVVVVVQLLLSLIGFGGDELDVDLGDGFDGDGDVGFLSVRAIAGFLGMFGLAGWAGTISGWEPLPTAGVALLAGVSTFALVIWLLRLQRGLDSSGTLAPENAVGKVARVYLRIPAEGAGRGKITVEIQGRSAEYEAFTKGPELATGHAARVVRMSLPGVFEVEAAD